MPGNSFYRFLRILPLRMGIQTGSVTNGIFVTNKNTLHFNLHVTFYPKENHSLSSCQVNFKNQLMREKCLCHFFNACPPKHHFEQGAPN
jgi:hypothetical protein